MAMTARKAAKPILGHDKPRISPPVPARTLVKDFEATANELGMTLMPWQRETGRYMYAINADGDWLYPEVAVIVSRQNGKSEMFLPLIMHRLAMGRRVLHAAQTRDLPRKFFERKLVPEVQRVFGFKARIRKGAGQESIEIAGGASYTIVAGTGGAPRGLTVDDILLDEVRELKPDFVFAVLPTNIASKNRQTIYLSNAGSENSTVLNSIRVRAGEDPALAWLEWSAGPDREIEDRAGWAEANPALGHTLTEQSLATFYTSNKLAGTLATFETEHLCRWVTTMRQRLVEPEAWLAGRGPLEVPTRPVMAFSMDPDGRRASAAIAWRRADGSIGLHLTYNVTGSPIDTDRLGEDLRKDATRLGIRTVGYDPLTDAELAKFFVKPVSLSGGKFANATAQFVNLVNAGKVRWSDADAVTDDLAWTARKDDRESGSYEAVRVKDDRPITASLAAIRAVWLASSPPVPSLKVR